MHRALYSFLHQVVEAPEPTWRLGMLVVQQSFEVLLPPQLMTITTAVPDGALSSFPSCSLSHRRGHHLQSVQPPYVACYPICFSISNAHHSMCPVILAPYLHGGVPWLLLYGHRDIYVMLLLGQQRCMQVWLLLWVALYRALTYSLTPFVPGSVCAVGNNRSTGSHGLHPIIKKYGEYPVICDLVEL